MPCCVDLVYLTPLFPEITRLPSWGRENLNPKQFRQGPDGWCDGAVTADSGRMAAGRSVGRKHRMSTLGSNRRPPARTGKKEKEMISVAVDVTGETKYLLAKWHMQGPNKKLWNKKKKKNWDQSLSSWCSITRNSSYHTQLPSNCGKVTSKYDFLY